MTLEDIQQIMRDRANEARRLERLVTSDKFLEAFDLRDPDELIPLDDLDAWIEKKKSQDPDCMTLRELREAARKLGVPKYTHWSKLTLTIKVKNAIKQKQNQARRTQANHERVANGDGPSDHQGGIGGLGGYTLLRQPSERGTQSVADADRREENGTHGRTPDPSHPNALPSEI